jgi:hypothetical protein
MTDIARKYFLKDIILTELGPEVSIRVSFRAQTVGLTLAE